MIKKILVVLFLSFCLTSNCFAFFKKKENAVIFLTPYNPATVQYYDKETKPYIAFKKDTNIYFTVFNPNGFKSNYIRYQIVKQDDNAHQGGYTRIKNTTVRVKDKYNYVDYFRLNEKGKYFLQIFDLENLQQWLAIIHFVVTDD